MRMTRPVFLFLLFTIVVTTATAQDPSSRPLNREQMWPAPTEADWARPCLITWQRTWDDALAVARETGKAILICVNMDGEIASEHYAGVRYRQPEIAALYEPYVTVIASTYRHTPRDYDDEGNRILCPRFGSVTCGEHIAIEPILYEKFFDQARVAPRHIMVELDGTEQYDVYYRNDVASVFGDIRRGIDERKAEPKVVVRGDRSIVERVASQDIRDRQAVEAAYRKGDQDLRRSLLNAAAELGSDAPVELLRLALMGLDPDMSKLARASLARTESSSATDLISEALRVPMDEAERTALIAALERLGEQSPRARWLAVVHQGLAGGASAIDLEAWSKVSREYAPAPRVTDLSELEARQKQSAGSYGARPRDAEACVELAEASFALAMRARKDYSQGIQMSRIVARHMFEDARRSAEMAGKLGAPAWRVKSIEALVAYYRGDPTTAYALSEAAVREMPPGDPEWNSMAVLTIFAEGRFKAIRTAARENRRWPPEWLSDLDAAYTALLSHPLGTDEQVIWHHDLLLWLGVKDRATDVIRAGLERFPGSAALHDFYRKRLLDDRGVRGLEAAYEQMLRADEPDPSTVWFAAYASFVGAEFHRRAGRPDRALAAYDLAMRRYETAAKANARWRDGADLWISLSLAGRARIAYERKDDAASLADITAALRLKPDAAATADGLGVTPAATAQMLMARLIEERKDDFVRKLEAALEKVDPALLAPNEE